MFFGIPEWAIGVAIIILAAGVGRAMIARFTPPGQLRGGGRGKPWSRHETPTPGGEEVASQLPELDDLQRRLADVEERLDFAERMLSQQRESQRLGPPQK